MQTRVLSIAAAVVLGLYAAVVVTLVIFPIDSLGYDVIGRVHAVQRVVDGQPLYLDPTGASFFPGSLDLFYGPPALALSAAPLMLLDDGAIARLTMPLSVLVVGLAVWFVSHGLRRDQVLALLVGMALSFAVFGGAVLGAASLIVLFAVALADRLLQDERLDLWTGLTIGTAAALRVYPAALFLPLILARRWTAVAAGAAALIAWTAAGLVFAGSAASVTFAGLLGHLTTPAGMPSLSLPLWLGVPAGLVALVYAGRDIRARWGFACAGMLLMAPLAWDHYATALLPLVAFIARRTGSALAGLLPITWLPGGVVGALPLVVTTLAGVAVEARRRLGAGASTIGARRPI